VSTFVLKLQDATRAETIEHVQSFVAQDSSGSFGLQAGHVRFMASLTFGLARFRTGAHDWQYLALPGALVYFHDNVLILSTRHYVLGDDYTRISAAVGEQLQAEEAELETVKSSLHRLEEEALRRMWRLGQPGA
jgi:F-type H+-transporting ATPase subunit epsilon